MDPRRVASQAASGELPRRVDAVLAETGEGPCLDAVYEEQTVRIPDMRTETRWPTLAQRALAAGGGQHALAPAVRPRGQPRCPRPPAGQGSATHHVEKLERPSVSGLSDPKTPKSRVHDDDLELNDHTAEVTP